MLFFEHLLLCSNISVQKCSKKRTFPYRSVRTDQLGHLIRPSGLLLGLKEPLKNSGSHIDASHSRQPLVKGERLVRYEVNAVMPGMHCKFFMPVL